MASTLSTNSPAYRRRILFQKIPFRFLILLLLTAGFSALYLLDSKFAFSSAVKLGPTIVYTLLLVAYWFVLARLCRKFRHRSRTMKHHYLMMIVAYALLLVGMLAVFFICGLGVYEKLFSVTLLYKLFGKTWLQLLIFHGITIALILLEPVRHIIRSKKQHQQHHHHSQNGNVRHRSNHETEFPDVVSTAGSRSQEE